MTRRTEQRSSTFPATGLARLVAGCLAAASLLLPGSVAEAGTQDNAVVALHVRTWLSKGVCTSGNPNSTGIPCSDYQTSWPLGTPSLAYLVVAHADPVAGIAGLSFGVEYGANLSVFWNGCAFIDFASLDWPQNGSGNRITWDPTTSCQQNEISPDGVHAVVGAFYVYAYAEDELRITGNTQLQCDTEVVIADCAGVETKILNPSRIGWVSFTDDPIGHPGYNPCSAEICDPCVAVAASGGEGCVGDTVVVPVTVDNCSFEPGDITVNCTVGGIPEPPRDFPNVPAGGSVNFNLEVPCPSPGEIPIGCRADWVQANNPACTVSDSVSAVVTAREPCVQLTLNWTGALVGEDASVEVEVDNCHADQFETLTIDCVVPTVLDTTVTHTDVPAGGSRVDLIPVPCTAAGPVTFTCTATAALTSDPTCVATVTDSVVVKCQDTGPYVTSIVDVENDQGRWVRIRFDASPLDEPASPTPIMQYEAFRRIDPLPAGFDGPAPAPKGKLQSDPGILLAGWEFAGAVPAHGESEYNMIAPTLADSSADHGIHWSVFFLRAATDDPYTFYDSPPDSGYSVDNLAPNAPLGLQMTAGVLSWEPAPEPDFRHFTVYGSESSAMDESAQELATPVETSWDTNGHPYGYYHVTASDFAGNEGKESTVSSQTAVPGAGVIPTEFSLQQNRPNPFRSGTTIRFDLPRAVFVRLRVYDVRGTLVRSLIGRNLPAGTYTTSWSGRNSGGDRVAPGIYFLRLETPEFTQVRKALLVR